MPRGLGSSLSSHPQHRALPPQQHAGSLSQQGIMRHGGRRWTFPVRGGVSGDGYVLNGSSGSGADTCGGNGGAGAGGSCGGADHSRSLSAHPLTRDLSDLGRSASGTSLGSVSDMQQLVSAFARSAQTPPIGGAWSNGDGGATRGLSPPPPSWARAFAQVKMPHCTQHPSFPHSLTPSPPPCLCPSCLFPSCLCTVGLGGDLLHSWRRQRWWRGHPHQRQPSRSVLALAPGGHQLGRALPCRPRRRLQRQWQRQRARRFGRCGRDAARRHPGHAR